MNNKYVTTVYGPIIPSHRILSLRPLGYDLFILTTDDKQEYEVHGDEGRFAISEFVSAAPGCKMYFIRAGEQEVIVWDVVLFAVDTQFIKPMAMLGWPPRYYGVSFAGSHQIQDCNGKFYESIEDFKQVALAYRKYRSEAW